MIDRARLLADLRPLVSALEEDIRAHAEATPGVVERITADHAHAVAEGRTSMELKDWFDDEVTQAAVAWVLACVFVRFLEDNELIADPLLSGPGPRRQAALGRREVFFQQHPSESDREYLLWCFDQAAKFPAVAPLYDPRHTPFRSLVPSVDGAAVLRELWVRQDPETGTFVNDFTDPALGTRFLGDLYQDLSDEAQDRYALLQTPDFVESFILDRTLEPAIDEFGLAEVRLIDPTCGSGHFLISAFERILGHWREREPGTEIGVLAKRALGAVYGVDLNPFATEIARFRLIVAALREIGARRLDEAPDFELNLATGDSLLHGAEPGQLADMSRYREGIRHVYETEDAAELAHILGQGYHAVVGNPPYKNPADAALRDAYRHRYDSCHGRYALTVPFMERFFELARPEVGERGVAAGYVGKITANSFMKREFGAPLVEKFLPSVDLTTIIDTSGAYIPGHGTPTVVLLARARPSTSSTVRVLDAVRGEPSQPKDPAQGAVWSSIVERVDQPGTEDRFIRVSDVEKVEFEIHPMTLGVGRDLRKALEESSTRLGAVAADFGRTTHTGEDNAFFVTVGVAERRGIRHHVPLVKGDAVRDWSLTVDEETIFPYDMNDGARPDTVAADVGRALWPVRTTLRERRDFGQTPAERGLWWWEHSMFFAARYRTLLAISWGEVATHNHFVLDRGPKVFTQTAPVIKLPRVATEADHLALLSVLNSSTACFWLKQVCQTKGSSGMGRGVYDEGWEFFFQLNATNLKALPLPAGRPVDLASRLDTLARERSALLDDLPAEELRDHGTRLAARDSELFAEMVSLQEELDWKILAAYDLLPDGTWAAENAPPLRLGERAFEIVLARQRARGEVETEWFARHGSTPITELPDRWPAEFRALVERRIELIENDPDVGLIERPEHKRRWVGLRPFADRLRDRLESLVLDRLEDADLWGGEPRLRSVSELADVVRRGPQLSEACALIAGTPDADVGEVVRRLVTGEAVPFLAAMRHTKDGMRSRAIWERVWDLQRAEDRGEDVGEIPVPTRYKKSDFRPGPAWALRGKLDVPKERFVSVPGAESAAGDLLVGWAGWDETDRARVLAARILELQSEEAADAERLTPLLAGVLELLPWIHQWHPEPDPAFGQPVGVFFDDWLDGTLSSLGLTRGQLRDWRPADQPRGRRAAIPTPA